MAVLQDYYKILEVSQRATEEEIKTAYRKLAKQYHPDVHPGDSECERKFREINEAYGILGDAEKRKRYDAERKHITQGKSAGQEKKREVKQDNGSVDFSSLQKSFESFFGFRPDDRDMTFGKKENSKETNPLDTTDLFENFMGIKR